MAEYEDEIRAAGKAYAELQAKADTAYKVVEQVQREWEKARDAADGAAKKLHKYVGRNIDRRIISVSEGKVVIVQLHGAGNFTSVRVEDVL